MIRFKNLAFLDKKLFFKNTTKRFKSNQSALHESFVSDVEKDEVYSSQNLPAKALKLRKLASEKNVDLNECITKKQTAEEVENMFKEIAQGDAEVERKLRLLLYEISLSRDEEKDVPNVLMKKHWEELLKLSNLSGRTKYLNFLFKKEKKKEALKIKDAIKRKESKYFGAVQKDTPHIYYGLGGYSLFMRIYPQTLLQAQDLRVISNKLFSSPILFDCSYQEYMNSYCTKYCAHQIGLAHQLNRTHQYPCSLQLVNLKKDDLLMKYLKVNIQNIDKDNFSLETYEKSYLDLYPKERIVYLTPHTRNVLEYKEDDIYVIGAYVDKGDGVQASLAKAKENNLRMAKLPLDNFLLWRKGTKSLTLNNVLNILLDMRYYKNWRKALESIPARNLRD